MHLSPFLHGAVRYNIPSCPSNRGTIDYGYIMFFACIIFPPHVGIGFTIHYEFVLFFTWNMFYPCPRNVFPVLAS
jgi:hypothetical protein